jgi:hypothetical protein
MDVRTSQQDDTATRTRRLRRLIVGTLVSTAIVLDALLALAPPLLEFAVAVALAMWWCLWLDRLSDPTDAWPAPTPDGGSQVMAEVGRTATDPVETDLLAAARDRAA